MTQRDEIQPILEAIPAARQEDARHYGVHPYFTRRPANVVRAYVARYSRVGDVVLDPFGGTGVTAIEAFLLGREAIQNDLNPFANFIAASIAETTLPSIAPLRGAFHRIETRCRRELDEVEKSSDSEARSLLRGLPLPANIRLPRSSDAEFYYDMFTPRQLAGLAILKRAIDEQAEGPIRNCLLLAWSATIAKLNKTWLSTKGRLASRGGSSIFSIYRYKLASQCVELPLWGTFAGRLENVIEAKKEVLKLRDYFRAKSHRPDLVDSRRQFRVLACDAAALGDMIEPGSVDYIFTDPPYGGFITYLDLSILWNHWLGFAVNESERRAEAIVGGECNLSEAHYKAKLAQSIAVCLKLLKPDRWFSIVFQHWDVGYFAAILESATENGAQLKAAVTQTGDVIWSMHKKKHSQTVLAGEMILTFYKPANKPRPKDRSAARTTPLDCAATLETAFNSCLRNGQTVFTSEALFNRLILELWEQRALGCLQLDRREFASRLRERGWTYDEHRHRRQRTGVEATTEADSLLPLD
ncbi:MAG: DNA methyltransferase [Limisphaerales bacterium]